MKVTFWIETTEIIYALAVSKLFRNQSAVVSARPCFAKIVLLEKYKYAHNVEKILKKAKLKYLTGDTLAGKHDVAEKTYWNVNIATLTNQMVNYEFNGYDWPLTCKTGKNQSPVDLQSRFASTNTTLAICAKGFEAISSGKVLDTIPYTLS